MRKVLSTGICLLSFFMGHGQNIVVSSFPAKGFYSNRPAQKWEESLVTGNGIMGVMVAGNPYNESIVFNHFQLYLPINEPLKPVSQGKHLPALRQKMLDGKYAEAAQDVVVLSQSEGYEGKRWTDPFIPAFQLNISSDTSKISAYSRTVDFISGETEVKWSDSKGIFSRRLFISRADNVVVMQLRANMGASINTNLSLSQILTSDPGARKKFMLDEKNGIAKVESKATENGLVFRAWYERPYENSYHGYNSFKGYEGAVKVITTGGNLIIEQDQLIINNAKEVLVLACVEPSKDMNISRISDLFNQLNSCSTDYKKLLARHAVIHNNLFSSVSLDLGESEADSEKSSEELLLAGGNNHTLIEKIFDAARYNVICATGINPPNLQGIWGATMTPPWSGDYTTNGNLPTVIAHYLQSNTPELMLPLFDKLESFMDDFRVNARELFNCRGIHVPSRFSNHGLNNHFDATYPMSFWTAGAAWYSMFYYDYYLYTLDKEFLKNRAFPFMVEAALFYEDFLTEGANGKYVFNPSYSPENKPSNYQSQACINATMDVMAANALFRSVIEASRILNMHSDKIEKWGSILKRMPPYAINENGEIREWMWGDLQDNHNHRHASHLWGLYDLHDPLIMSNPDLIKACKQAVDKRMEIRRKDNGGIMAFGMVQLASAACALGEKETTHDMLTWLGDCYWNNNLVSTHDPKKTFNLDICGGYPSLVMKMLAYSEPGFISLLPCLPVDWVQGNIKGTALRGGIIMNELKWNGDKVQATLLSKIDQVVRIQVRGAPKGEIKLSAGYFGLS